MSEPLYVDPEAVTYQARPYTAAAAEWLALQATIAGIGLRYASAWGDDDLGQQFGPQFTQGLYQVEEGVTIIGDTLTYYGDGLTETGQIYGEARDEADETSHQYLVTVETTGEPAPTLPAAPVLPAGPLAFGVRIEGERLTPGEEGPLVARRAERGRLLTPLEPEEGVKTPLKPLTLHAKAVRPAERLEGDATEPVPLQPARLLPRALAGVNPPPGEYWSDGYWLYTPGGAFIALENVDAPPAGGGCPPAGTIWNDGTYLYTSDGQRREISTLDSPLDHL